MTPSAAMLAWIIANGKDSRFAGKGARPLMQRLSSSAAMAASAAGDEPSADASYASRGMPGVGILGPET